MTSLHLNQPSEQAGFRKRYPTIDHYHTTSLVLKESGEHDRPLFKALVDNEESLHIVKTSAVMQPLRIQGVQKVFLDVLENIYSGCVAVRRRET